MHLKNKTFNSVKCLPSACLYNTIYSETCGTSLSFSRTSYGIFLSRTFELSSSQSPFFPLSGEGATIPLLRVSNKWVRSQRSCLTGCGDPVIDTHQQNDIWDQHNTNRERKRRAGTGGGCGNSSQASGHIPTGDFAKRRQWDGWNVTLQSEEQDLFLYIQSCSFIYYLVGYLRKDKRDIYRAASYGQGQGWANAHW